MPLDIMRTAVEQNAMLVERLHEAHARCDPDAIRDLLAELDLNNADLILALEELIACPPTGGGSGDDGPTSRGR